MHMTIEISQSTVTKAELRASGSFEELQLLDSAYIFCVYSSIFLGKHNNASCSCTSQFTTELLNNKEKKDEESYPI